jgi:small ligand-binding sensory domain FIST
MLDDDNALFCIGEIPSHAMLALLEAPQVDSSNTLKAMQLGLSRLQGDTKDKQLLLFYCAGRRQHLGNVAASEELHAFNQLTQAAAVAGALALGEIGGSTLWGYPLFQNATLVTANWGTCA